MQQAYFENSILPWSPDPQEKSRFNKTLIILVALMLVIGIAVPLINLPEKTREEMETIPPQLAKIVLEKRVIEKPVEQPKPVEPPKEEKKREETKQIEEPKPEPRPVETKKPVEVKTKVEAAREVAKQSGLLALNDELADMRESMSASSFKSTTLNTATPVNSSRSERLVTDISTRSSGGVDSSQLAAVTHKVGVGNRATTKLEAPESGGGAVSAPREGNGKGKISSSRSIEEIRRIFDSNKAAIYAIYSRSLRSNPSLQGQVLLELTIDPSGRVSACKILSSELSDPDLEKRILARVKLFNFGLKDVKSQVVTYPLVFLPS